MGLADDLIECSISCDVKESAKSHIFQKLNFGDEFILFIEILIIKIQKARMNDCHLFKFLKVVKIVFPKRVIYVKLITTGKTFEDSFEVLFLADETQQHFIVCSCKHMFDCLKKLQHVIIVFVFLVFFRI